MTEKLESIAIFIAIYIKGQQVEKVELFEEKFLNLN